MKSFAGKPRERGGDVPQRTARGRAPAPAGGQLLALQATAGNEAVARHLAPGLRASGVLQRVWDEDQLVEKPPTGQGNWDAAVSEEDAATIGDAVKQATAAKGEKRALVFYGVGTGNPGATFAGTNVSASASAKMIAYQRDPGFLRDAARYGLFVVALNFNADGKGVEVQEADERGTRFMVGARFPLKLAGPAHHKQAWSALQGLAAKAERFALMNAINQFDYEGMIAMVPIGKGSYLTSYAEEKTEAAYTRVRFPKKVMFMKNAQPEGFGTMRDAFYGLPDVEERGEGSSASSVRPSAAAKVEEI